MNYTEAEKKASKAPWLVTPGFTLSTSHHRYIAQFDASEGSEFALADAALAAHCRNHFAKLLEGLEHFLTDAKKNGSMYLFHEDWWGILDAAKEVKMEVTVDESA